MSENKQVKSYKLFVSDVAKAEAIAKELKTKLNANGFVEKQNDFDIGIAVGGDGSFLNMVRLCNFDSDAYFVGVNAGTLGFLQEIKPDEIDDFINKLKSGAYKIEQTGIQETDVFYGGGNSKFFTLNEIVVRELNLKTAYLDVLINDVLLENFAGDGLLISTSCGSTAYNLSFGGSVVYSDLHTLQITPIAPLNSVVYKSLRNSIIVPEDRIIKLIPRDKSKNLYLSIDGRNEIFNDVKLIQTKTSSKKIKILRLSKYDYTKVINEKFM